MSVMILLVIGVAALFILGAVVVIVILATQPKRNKRG